MGGRGVGEGEQPDMGGALELALEKLQKIAIQGGEAGGGGAGGRYWAVVAELVAAAYVLAEGGGEAAREAMAALTQAVDQVRC